MASSTQATIQISDDEMFRRKLLMDGEGMGDDRRINILLRTFFKWNDAKDESDEEVRIGYERLLTALANCEFLMTKSQQAQEVNKAEIEHYENLYTEIETRIKEAQQTILDKKAELQQSKRVRKNKQQYDALARIISEQPDRKETHSKLQSLGEEIANLEKTKQELQMKLEKRHKQFKVLLSAAYQLQQIIKNKNDSPEIMRSQVKRAVDEDVPIPSTSSAPTLAEKQQGEPADEVKSEDEQLEVSDKSIDKPFEEKGIDTVIFHRYLTKRKKGATADEAEDMEVDTD